MSTKTQVTFMDCAISLDVPEGESAAKVVGEFEEYMLRLTHTVKPPEHYREKAKAKIAEWKKPKRWNLPSRGFVAFGVLLLVYVIVDGAILLERNKARIWAEEFRRANPTAPMPVMPEVK